MTKDATGFSLCFEAIENSLEGADVAADKREIIEELTDTAIATQACMQPVENDP